MSLWTRSKADLAPRKPPRLLQQGRSDHEEIENKVRIEFLDDYISSELSDSESRVFCSLRHLLRGVELDAGVAPADDHLALGQLHVLRWCHVLHRKQQELLQWWDSVRYGNLLVR